MHEALFYTARENKTIDCALCPHRCTIAPGATGICGVRKNSNGTLESVVYGQVIAEHVDPIEKKPFFHFYPGSRAYSLATVGCNFRCRHCQNAEISQMPKDRGIIMGTERTPEDIVRRAQENGCASISYTYTEPTVYYEFAYDTARLAHERGIKNNFVTNGYINPEPLEHISPYLDAANIDLKAFSDDFYKNICGGRLQPVLDAIRHYKRLGIWIEITTLIIPELNDDPRELEDIAHFIADVGTDTPWHVTAFHPMYRMLDKPRTNAATLHKAREIGLRAGLSYVYTGNVPGEEGENTYCARCGAVLIRRYGFFIRENNLRNGACPTCGNILAGRFT
ncbi:MAG: AmmeMemoRadiSam system radical SAM enzyme [Desulfobacterota bacterium]|nr:AmmeMemoRadiSam system radical SAM enzyme [Thermodesulfobacteriota bacterium]